jgi:hypothetical protein
VKQPDCYQLLVELQPLQQPGYLADVLGKELAVRGAAF